MKIFVSGLFNLENNIYVKKFPIDYSPIEYSFNQTSINISGVGYNITKALHNLNDEVVPATFLGKDSIGKMIERELKELEINTEFISNDLDFTCSSVILYDESGRRKIYCDLKDIQEKVYPSNLIMEEVKSSLGVVVCNINYNKEIIKIARELNKTIFTDVHVLSDINDEYNKKFMENANVLFLSDEGIKGDRISFMKKLFDRYKNDIIVIGCGKEGALLLDNTSQKKKIYSVSSIYTRKVVNTCGAGDALFSCFVHYYLKTKDVLKSIKYATAFASYKIGSSGGANGFLKEEDLERLFEKIEGEIIIEDRGE